MTTLAEEFPALAEQVQTMLAVCHRLYEKGFVIAYDGNVSVRIGDHILVTPTHLSKGAVQEEDLIVVDLRGDVCFGNRKPSSELRLHLALYEKKPTCRAIVHAHPLYATTIYRRGRAPEISCLMEAALSLGEHVPLVPFADHGTQALADAVGAAMREEDVCACVLERHGTVTVGDDLWQAYFRTESLERLAHTETILATANF